MAALKRKKTICFIKKLKNKPSDFKEDSFVAIREDGEFKVGHNLLFVDRSSVIFCLVQLYEKIETVVIDLRSTEFEKKSDVLERLAYRATKLPPDTQLLRGDSVQNKLIKFFVLGDLFLSTC